MTGVMLQKVAQKLTVPTRGVGEWSGDLETGWEEALPWVGILYVRPEADRREWRGQKERPSFVFVFVFVFGIWRFRGSGSFALASELRNRSARSHQARGTLDVRL